MKHFVLSLFVAFTFCFPGYSQNTLFYQSFDTTWTITSSIPGWSGTTTPANQVWHKNNYTTGWTSPSSGALPSGGANGTSYSARFHSCGAASGSKGNIITPSVNCSSSPGCKFLTFYFTNGNSGSDELDVFLSYDGGVSWGNSVLKLRNNPSWTKYTVPLGAVSVSNLRIKFEASQGGAAGSSDIGIDEVRITDNPVSYATLPYFQNFESTWINKSSIRDIPDLYWNACPETGNCSFRRNDDGASASWSSSSSGTPASSGKFADFHTFSSYNTHFGYLDLFLNFSQSGTKKLSFDYINTDGADNLCVLISTDGGRTFTNLSTFNLSSSWQSQNLGLGNSSSSFVVLRFLASSDYGTSDIGIDNVSVCTIPVADAGADLQVCASSAGLAAVTPAFGNGVWSVTSGSLSFNNTADPGTQVSGAIKGTSVLRWTVNSGVCQSFDEMNLTNALPDAGRLDVTSKMPCPGAGVTFTLRNFNGNIQWKTASAYPGPWVNTGSSSNTLSISPLNAAGFYRAEVSSCGTTLKSDSFFVQPGFPGTWKGGGSSDWNDPANWCSNSVPLNSTDVYIPEGASPFPVISTSASCRNLRIFTGATLTVQNSLNVYGDLNVDGNLINNGNTFNLCGTSKSLTGKGDLRNCDLIIKSGASYDLNRNMVIQSLQIESGASFLMNSDSLEIISSLNQTGVLNLNHACLTWKGNGSPTLQGNNFIAGTGKFYYKANGNNQIVYSDKDLFYNDLQIMPATGFNIRIGTGFGVKCKSLLITGTGGYAYLGDSLFVDGNLEISAGAEFHAGSGLLILANSKDIRITGNWTNNGLFDPWMGKVVLYGNNIQQIKGIDSTDFYDVCIKKSSDIRLNRTMGILNSLELTGGNLVLQGNTLRILNTDGTAIIRKTGGIISEDKSNCNSKACNKSVISWKIQNDPGGTGQHIFPFITGDGDYIPFKVSLRSGSIGTLNVSTYHADTDHDTLLPLPAGVKHLFASGGAGYNNSENMVHRFWQIDASGSTTPVLDLTFTYVDDPDPLKDEKPFSNTNGGRETSIRAQRWEGNGWKAPLPAQFNDPAADSIHVTGVTEFSPWALSKNQSPLEIIFLTWSARYVGDSIHVVWKKVPGLSGIRFQVMRFNGRYFECIAKVDELRGKQEYEFMEARPDFETSIYKLIALKETSILDSTPVFEIRKPITKPYSLVSDANGSYILSLITITEADITLLNSHGQVLFDKEGLKGVFPIQLPGKGCFFLRIQCEKGVFIEKLIY